MHIINVLCVEEVRASPARYDEVPARGSAAPHDVSCVEVTLSVEGLRGGLRIVHVALHHAGAFHCTKTPIGDSGKIK